VLSALHIAARSGVDVRLMIPCKPDHPFVYWASYSYVGDLLSAGARCYTYENGFLHAKGVMTDGKVSSFGTANMDIRSFELNFEVNAVIYDEETTKKLEALFIEDLKVCKEITRESYGERGIFIRIKEQGSRLLSPLL
jgi:cardiolipin synthase